MTRDYTQTSNWTGRTPRTLSQAFGPYADGLTYQPQPRNHNGSIAVVVAMVALILTLVLKP